jgi:single-stranded DNA-binding protein
MNTVTLVGTIQGPIEIRYSRDGVALSTLRVAHARPIRNSELDNGETEVDVFEVVCHGEMAENVALTLDTKMLAQVTGSITYLSTVDDEGQVQRRVVIDASDVAPSLRLATAEVVRTERRHPSEV